MTKILWADDQVDVVKSAAAVAISDKLFSFDFCSNGIDALAKIKEKQYDIILIDLAMPPNRWGGLWLLEELKKIGRLHGVIVVSGEGAQAETIKALRLGATDYITKEELVYELNDRIQNAIDDKKRRTHETSSMISSGESEIVEFKSTLRKNLSANRNDSEIELAVFKTICGFMNKNGGNLFIGVADDGSILGLENDDFKNDDKFQLHFWNIFKNSIGIEFVKLISAGILTLENKSIFHIKCSKSEKPIFLKWKKENKNSEAFFVRVGPQTEQLGTRQAIEYIKNNFKN
ncbi:putative DNA binding domain-containing protein [Serratia marcescens]|nr:putative DNA binding domain-containing protein [Serratia marcescens]